MVHIYTLCAYKKVEDDECNQSEINIGFMIPPRLNDMSNIKKLFKKHILRNYHKGDIANILNSKYKTRDIFIEECKKLQSNQIDLIEDIEFVKEEAPDVIEAYYWMIKQAEMHQGCLMQIISESGDRLFSKNVKKNNKSENNKKYYETAIIKGLMPSFNKTFMNEEDLEEFLDNTKAPYKIIKHTYMSLADIIKEKEQ